MFVGKLRSVAGVFPLRSYDKFGWTLIEPDDDCPRGFRQVCGLKWSPDGSTLASGGNENYLCLWDSCMSSTGGAGGRMGRDHKPRKTLVEHQAAVKALAWCPFQRHLLASGGGTADRTIKVGEECRVSGAPLHPGRGSSRTGARGLPWGETCLTKPTPKVKSRAFGVRHSPVVQLCLEYVKHSPPFAGFV